MLASARLLIAIITLMLCGQESLADQASAAFAISKSEFEALSDGEQFALLRSAIEHRLALAANIYYEAQYFVSVNRYKDNTVGEVVKRLNGSRFRHWRLGSSYKMETIRGGVDASSPEVIVENSWNADDGIAMAFGSYPRVNELHGRISAEQDRIVDNNRYSYWLDGEHRPDGDCLVRYMLQHLEEGRLHPGAHNKFVLLELPWYTLYSHVSAGIRKLYLDSEKGFMPVSGYARWDLTEDPNAPFWRREEFVIEEAELIRDVWMPSSLREVVGTSSFRDDQLVNVHITNVSKIIQGKVAADDLLIRFQPGTKVVDEFRMETYRVGDDSAPTNVQPVYDALREEMLPDAASARGGESRPVWFRLLLYNGIVLLVVVLFVFRRSIRGRRRS